MEGELDPNFNHQISKWRGFQMKRIIFRASSAKTRAGAFQDFTKWAIENNQNSNMISLFSLTSDPILNKLWHLHIEGKPMCYLRTPPQAIRILFLNKSKGLFGELNFDQ